MKLGFLPPMERGRSTSPDWVIRLAEMVEGLGVHSIFGVEHVVIAEDYEPLYPYSADGRMPAGPSTVIPDPLEWLSFVAARTSDLRLGTAVIIASQHSAAILAKRAATLDALSGGRFEMGVGLGWQREEYEAIGVPYRDRGRRLDENIEAMRALWRDAPATYHGKYVSFDRVHCDVKCAQPGGVPIVIGGSTDFAARRAGRLGDGFFPFVISPEDFAERVELIGKTAREHGRDPQQIELTAWPGSLDFERGFDLPFVRAYAQAGASRLVISGMESGSAELDDMRDLIRRYQDEILARL